MPDVAKFDDLEVFFLNSASLTCPGGEVKKEDELAADDWCRRAYRPLLASGRGCCWVIIGMGGGGGYSVLAE